MLEINSFTLFISGIAFILAAVFLFYQKLVAGHTNQPPCYSGWIPWVGCAIEFGKAPLNFIEQTRKKLGAVFTIQVAGKRLTFLTENEDYHHFFTSDCVSFQEAVQQPVYKAGSIPRESFIKNHTMLHDAVKGRLASDRLKPYSESLSREFREELEKWGKSGNGDLYPLVRKTMYIAVLNNLFGEGVLPIDTNASFAQFEKNFVKFDDDFEYGSQLPEIFLGDWSKAKWWLLNVFKKIRTISADVSSKENPTILETVLMAVDPSVGPNFALLMMWASLANAIPITFWTLGFIMSDEKIYEEVLKEVRDTLNPKFKGLEDVIITSEDLQKMPGVRRCMMEAIRLRSPGVITRRVVKSFNVKGYTVPVGDHLMLSTYWAHRNPKFFPNPDSFNPDRWKAADLDKNQWLDGFVAFGGGRYQCPGRWFALLEIHIYLSLILFAYDLKLEGKLPSHSPLHVVGTQHPEGPCHVSYSSAH